jgi:DNA-binding NarL/FixJ family response regulator
MTCRHCSCSRATWFQARYFEAMANILLISDATVVLDELLAVVDDGENEITSLRNADRLRTTVDTTQPDLVITDCQVQSMGGIAICLDLKLEESGGRLPHVPVLILLDRRADVFLAKTASAEGYLVKPLDPIRLRLAVEALLGGGAYHDESYKPITVQRTP